MTVIENLEKEVTALNKYDLSHFRNWFYQFDSDYWDAAIEKDAYSGKFSELANSALKEFETGSTVQL